jgi:phage baseplate assembly protein W
MAFEAKRIYPIDTKPSIGVGIGFPFSSPGVFTKTLTTQNAIKTNLINYLLTESGERPLNPEFGGGLRKFLFEQINSSTVQFLKEDIQSKILNNFPEVVIQDLNVIEYPDNNQFKVTITYFIANTGITDTLNISFS